MSNTQDKLATLNPGALFRVKIGGDIDIFQVLPDGRIVYKRDILNNIRGSIFSKQDFRNMEIVVLTNPYIPKEPNPPSAKKSAIPVPRYPKFIIIKNDL